VKLTRELGASDMKWKPGSAVWAFIVPIVSLVRPYQVLSAVQQRLEPEEIMPPVPRVDRDVETDYRNVAFVVPPLAKGLSSSMLGLWWASFVAMNIVGRIAQRLGPGANDAASVISAYEGAMFASVLAVVSGLLAIRVVRSLTARLEERFRRIRHSTPEALAEQQIILDEA
jgi:hypothetical protein